MKIFLIFAVLVVVCYNEASAHTCNGQILQKDVDYSRLRGEWWQAYYTQDSRYSQFDCYDMRIIGLNRRYKQFYVQEIIQETRPKMGTIQQILLNTMCWENCVSDREININGHIATDYRNYMIIHTCVEGRPIIDIQLRKRIKKLPCRKIQEIAKILEKIGVNFFSLQERDRTTCPSPK
uniref:uncharacterized protein LOC120334347 n=1 Tax=Styela clava TaxID=7725 RepID=UPI00193ADB30|nr:uncharacterized protein LOC120334347 [Styela clava]